MVALTVLFEIPIFHVAPTLLRCYGVSALQQVASVTCVTRVVGYTLHGVMHACAKTSADDFMAQCMPPGYKAVDKDWWDCGKEWERWLGSCLVDGRKKP